MIKRVFQIFMAIGVTIAAIFYPVLIFGSFLCAKCVTFFSRNFKGFEEPVSGISKFISPDRLFKRPNSTLVTLAVLEKTPQPETVIKHFQHIYNLEDENSQKSGTDNEIKRKYKKLGYCIEPWCGYLFWRKVENFEIKNQIHFIYNTQMDERKVSEFVGQIIRKPFLKGSPLWEVFIITSSPKEEAAISNKKCFVIWRIHHILTDGMSLIKLWYMEDSAFAETPTKIPRPFKFNASAIKESKGNQKALRKFMRKWGIILYRAPYLSNKYLCAPGDTNCLTKGHKGFDGDWFCSGLNKIYLEQYRPYLRKLEFSLTNALLVGYGRGLKRFMGENFGVCKIPKAVKIMGSIPRSNHPDDEALTNHWAIMRYKAYLTSDNLKEQLEYSKKEYRRAVHDVLPEAFELTHDKGLRNVPTQFYEMLFNTKKAGTLSLSNLPGPTTQQNMFNIPVTDRAVWLPLVRQNSGIGLLLLTYNGWMTISITADSGCLKSKELFDKFNNAVMYEMQFVLDEVVRMSDSMEENNINEDENQNVLRNLNLPQQSITIDSCELCEVTVL